MQIVVLDGYTANPGDNPWDGLASLGTLEVFDRTSADEIVPRAISADVLVTNKTRLGADSLTQLPKLKMISVLATGYDVVDVASADSRGVVVCNVPAYATESVAQHVFCGLLGLLNRPESHHTAIQSGQWQRAGDFSFWLVPQVELAGKRLGIIGLGEIGQAVARIGKAFGMTILAGESNRPSRQRERAVNEIGIELLDQELVFETSDVISLHCPLNAKTAELINAERLAKMKLSSVLVNTARGGLIQEHDLADALNQGWIAGAFLDVVSVEPIRENNPLLTAKNCLITPHVGWATLEARRRLVNTTVSNVQAFMQGEPINRVRG